MEGSRRVLDVARGRSEKGAAALIEKALNPLQQYMVCGVAMDMSAPFENAVRKLMPCADVVFDKYHIEAHLNEGVDNTRKDENKRRMAFDHGAFPCPSLSEDVLAMGLRIPFHGSQKSPSRVSKIPSKGLKIPTVKARTPTY